MQNLTERNSTSHFNRNPLLEHILNAQVANVERNYYLKWGLINTVIAFALSFKVSCERFKDVETYTIECTLMIFVSISAFICIIKLFWLVLQQEDAVGTEEQKFLLTSQDDDSFKTVEMDENIASGNANDNEDIYFYVNWHSSLHKKLWVTGHKSGSPTWGSPQRLNNSFCISPNISPYTRLSDNNYLSDMPYMPNMDEEQSSSESIYISHCGENPANSFWNYYGHGALKGKSNAYQMALPPLLTAEREVFENANSLQFRNSNSEVIKDIPTEKLSQYLVNLRYWLSKTILKRVAKEITNMNEALTQYGISDIKIGAVSLKRLRMAAECHHLVETCVPMLPLLLPFLDAFPNQEYLVQRIKELSQNSYIADYRWKSGNSHNGCEWEEDLPTDAAILFHLFCVYLDWQLKPSQGGGRPFHSRYVITHEEKRSPNFIVNAVNNKAHCAIFSSNNQLSPHFNFISGNKVHNCVNDQNNLFYVIIEFLIYMKRHQESMLEDVCLGQSGINIMCVIED